MLEELYNKNKELDNIFWNKYSNSKDIFDKDSIELLVEIGEFINETKCFKYWSIKSINKSCMLEELADVITMLMTFANRIDMNISNYSVNDIDVDLLTLINNTYYLATKVKDELTKELLDKLFINVFGIAYKLNITDNDIKEFLVKKQKIILERLNSDY